MLKNLNIENIAVIEKADIAFSAGLNVLTGETGAGKSILVDSIQAILGERTSKELVRSGADTAYVAALFEDINDDVKDMLTELDIPAEEDNSLLVSRKISSLGKSTCRINGVPATVSLLKKIGSLLVNIHGQHDSQALLNPDYHYRFVDMTGSNKTIYSEYKDAFKNLVSIRRRLKALTADEDAKDRQLELLDYQIKEITEADIKPGEREALKNRKKMIQNAENIVNSLNMLLSALNGDDETSGIQTMLSFSQKEIEAVSNADSELKAIYEKLDSLYDMSEEIKDLTKAKLASVDYSENELEFIEERLDLLYRISSKYGKTEEDILEFLDEAVAKRNFFVHSDEELVKLNAEYDSAFEKTVSAANRLSEYRKELARRLENDVREQLIYLDMPKIQFIVNFDKGNLSPNGFDKIEFLISTNPGQPPKPLAKIASGGELSRIMLAIKNIIAKNDSVDTLIFDEIDTGVSGRASRKIGLKLREVSKHTQVICVTHSAQIASVADTHLLIEKEYRNDETYTKVSSLDFNRRKQELARIMGGLEITDTLLKTAEELLNGN